MMNIMIPSFVDLLSVDEAAGVNYKMRFWLRRLCTNKRHMQPQVALQVRQQPGTLVTQATLLPLPPLLVKP